MKVEDCLRHLGITLRVMILSVHFVQCRITARSELWKAVGFYVGNGSGTAEQFAPNSHRSRVWSLARTSLKVRIKGHQGQKRHFPALLAACMRFMFGKTSLASSFFSLVHCGRLT